MKKKVSTATWDAQTLTVDVDFWTEDVSIWIFLFME